MKRNRRKREKNYDRSVQVKRNKRNIEDSCDRSVYSEEEQEEC